MRRGLILIELVVAMAVLAILAATGTVAYTMFVRRARIRVTLSTP